MRTRSFLPLLILFLGGCAAFKELEPVPPVDPAERGYIELRNDKEHFVLKRDDKYFIKFPRPKDVHFYLVLETSAKKKVDNYFTATFHDGKGPVVPITDETASQDSISVFAVDTSNAVYYWVIDTVYVDMPLTLKYRYVPQWRYTVENKYDQYRRILSDNKFDRRAYEAMGTGFDFAAFNAGTEQQNLRTNTKALTPMYDELVKLEQVFPANIAASRDTMYQRYVGLRDDTRDELAFQSRYDEVLTVLQRESETKGNFDAFMERAPEFEKFLSQKDMYRAPVVDYARSTFLRRLEEALPSYESQLRRRDNILPFELKPAVAEVEKLYVACGQQLPDDLALVRDFVNDFKGLAKSVGNAETAFETARAATQNKVLWPADSYYPDLITMLDRAKIAEPATVLAKYDRYKDLKISLMLGEKAQRLTTQMDQLGAQYKKAADVVRQVNALRPQKDFVGIVQILRNNRDLGFVIAQYPDIDAQVLKSHADRIRDLLAANRFKETEQSLTDLQEDKNYLDVGQIAARKMQTVQSFEVELFEKVMNLSTARVDAFTKQNETTIDDVPTLYKDSAFLPVYTLTFSSESPGRVVEKRRRIDAYLNQVKFIRFPEAAIRAIYKDLTRAPREKGVEKARAVQAHATFYKGSDKSVLNIVSECDPRIAKTLTKPKEYRRLLVLPVNETASTSNEYLFRFNVKIPSEAQFPVFDVNIKVPPEVAENSKTKQWFSDMTLNKKVVKTEGHMRVTAPSADNDYEAQITPVQMTKGRDNIIEVRFKFPTFQLFEVSVMAQVPIIRKN
ncbi:MAG TPA: hypothetical protein VMM37_09320 [Bacteroidota bacterium]|nr:hypothetical protein [Bacteroidota bacterium]